MADKCKDSLIYREGPYEQWAFGIGAPYDSHADTGEQKQYTAIVTLPAPCPVEPLKVKPGSGKNQIGQPRLPTIWGLSTGMQHQFLPTVASVSPTDRAVAYRSLLNWIADFRFDASTKP